MKQYLTIATSLLLLTACGSDSRTITGDAGHLDGDMIYFYEPAVGYGHPTMIDSAEIVDGQFVLSPSHIQDQLVFIGTSPRKGGPVFIDGDKIEMLAGTNSEGETEWIVKGSPSDKLYREFLKQQYIVSEKQITDSLDNLFYAARDRGDRNEMARLKEESMEYYERGRKNEDKLIHELVGANMDNPFGIYLYYTYIFRRKDFPTAETLAEEREYIKGFGPRALATPYSDKMAVTLAKYANCAIGVTAPEISGADTLGNPLKLSDLRGNYVIVDFWDSYCHWCREETPHLLRAIEKFKGKNFRVLGVSSDTDKQRWLDAIQEDGSHWDHMILPAGHTVYDTYCIKGIPHIILVDPQGVILAKDLRWEDHITVTGKYLDAE